MFVLYFVKGFHTIAARTKNGRQKSWSITTGHILLFFVSPNSLPRNELLQ